MYILIVARGYPSERYKKNGIFEFDQAKALAQAGHKVIYAAVDTRSLRRVRKWGYESLKKDKVQIEAINIPCGRVPEKVLNTISYFALRNIYKKIFKKYGQPDIIHAHFIYVGKFTVQAFKNHEIPLILTEHFSGMNQNHLKPSLYKKGKYTYKRVDKVLAVGNHLANNITEKFGVKPLVVPNIVDTTNFKYIPMKNNKEIFNFISTGNLLPNKRMDLLIEAFNDAFKNNQKVRLYIFGDGPEKKKLEKMVEFYNIQDRVFLMGLVNRQVIAKKMRDSHCFVLVSKLETFGVAYIEAMASGLPVIATRCGGPEDFVNEENGILIDVDNKEELVKSLKDIYTGKFDYNNEKISQEIKERFQSRSIAENLVGIYEELIN